MLYGANDNHLDLHGNALSGWLVLQIPNVKEGIILGRMEWWCGTQNSNTLTKDWKEVNDGKTFDVSILWFVLVETLCFLSLSNSSIFNHLSILFRRPGSMERVVASDRGGNWEKCLMTN
jgi:hypothetical protein